MKVRFRAADAFPQGGAAESSTAMDPVKHQAVSRLVFSAACVTTSHFAGIPKNILLPNPPSDSASGSLVGEPAHLHPEELQLLVSVATPELFTIMVGLLARPLHQLRRGKTPVEQAAAAASAVAATSSNRAFKSSSTSLQASTGRSLRAD